MQDEKIAYNFYDAGTIAFYYTVLNYLYSAPDEELDQMFPSGYKVLQPPSGYIPIRPLLPVSKSKVNVTEPLLTVSKPEMPALRALEPESPVSKQEVEKRAKERENSVPKTGSHATPEQLRLEMPGKPLQSDKKCKSFPKCKVDSDSEREDSWMSELESHSRVCTRGECPKCDLWKESLFSSKSPKPKIRSQKSATEQKDTAKESQNDDKGLKNKTAAEPMVHAVTEPKNGNGARPEILASKPIESSKSQDSSLKSTKSSKKEEEVRNEGSENMQQSLNSDGSKKVMVKCKGCNAMCKNIRLHLTKTRITMKCENAYSSQELLDLANQTVAEDYKKREENIAKWQKENPGKPLWARSEILVAKPIKISEPEVEKKPEPEMNVQETVAISVTKPEKVKMSDEEIMAIFGAKPAIKVAKPPEVRAPASLITTKSQVLEQESGSPKPPRKTVKTLLPVSQPEETSVTTKRASEPETPASKPEPDDKLDQMFPPGYKVLQPPAGYMPLQTLIPVSKVSVTEPVVSVSKPELPALRALEPEITVSRPEVGVTKPVLPVSKPEMPALRALEPEKVEDSEQETDEDYEPEEDSEPETDGEEDIELELEDQETESPEIPEQPALSLANALESLTEESAKEIFEKEKDLDLSSETFEVIATFSGGKEAKNRPKSPIQSGKIIELKNLDEITFSSSEDSQEQPILNINFLTDSRPTSENSQVKTAENISQNKPSENISQMKSAENISQIKSANSTKTKQLTKKRPSRVMKEVVDEFAGYASVDEEAVIEQGNEIIP